MADDTTVTIQNDKVSNIHGDNNPKPVLTGDQQKIADAIAKTEGAVQGDKKPVTPPKIHKPIFKAPPAELLDKGEFKMGDDAPDDLTHDVEGNVLPVKETTKKDDTTTKKDDTTVKKETVVQAKEEGKKDDGSTTGKTTDIKVDPKAVKGFDYSDFSAEETAALKQMSNTAREFAAKNLRDLKRIQSEQPQAYYQHPTAYQLLPEYQKLNEDISSGTKEYNFWKQQLILVKAGKPWNMLTGWDEKGNPIITGPYKASEEFEVELMNALNTVGGKVNEYKGQQQTLQQQFQQRIKSGEAILKAERAKRFEWVDKPELLEEKINIPGMGDVTLKKIRDDFKGLFDTYHHTNPLMELAQDMFAALQVYGATIRNLEAQNKTTKELKDDALRMEPALDTTKGAATEKTDFDMAGLPD